MDYCNSALATLAKLYLQKLQSAQNMAAGMVKGARRCDRITPILEDLHWLPVSQRVVFKTAMIVCKCVHGVAPAYLSDLCIPTTATSGRKTHLCIQSNSTGSARADVGGATEFHRQRTEHLEQSAGCTTSIRAVTERLHTCIEHAPVLDRPAPLRHFCAIPAPTTNTPIYILTYSPLIGPDVQQLR